MTDLAELYQSIILEHNRSPRNYRALAAADRHAAGHNPLCGDQIEVFLALDGDRIADVAFQGRGCAIAKASASLMTEAIKGRTLQEAEELFTGFHRLVTEAEAPAACVPTKLAILKGVRAYPMRVKCATLAWHALHEALRGEGKGAGR